MRGLIFTFFFTALAPVALADFQSFVNDLKQEAQRKQLDATIIDDAFGGTVEMVHRAIQKKNNQPEVKFSFSKYMRSLVSPKRVGAGQQKFAANRALLKKLEQENGVPAEILVALWGIESHYGQHKGKFKILPSLATLAYNSHRKPFFRKQFFAGVQIVQEGHITLPEFKGSWAGAMGQVQFIPTSFLAYAVDGDGDGKKDLWHTEADILASASNYLMKNGWKRGQPVAQRVILSKYLPANLKLNKRGVSAEKTIKEWQALGLQHLNGQPFPYGNMPAKLYLPEGPTQKAYVLYHNFDVILRWNNSTHFAFAVHSLAEEMTP